MDIGSMNFDAQHDEDEDELLREEQEQQAELQARLANAFDDLIDDSDTSASSGDGESQNNTLDVTQKDDGNPEERWPSNEPNQHQGIHPSHGNHPPFEAQYPPEHYYPNYAPGYHSSQGEMGTDPAFSPHEGQPYPYQAHPPYYDEHFAALSPQYLAGYPPPNYHHGNHNGFHGNENVFYGDEYYNDFHGSGDGYHNIPSSQDEQDVHSDHEQRYHGYNDSKISYHGSQQQKVKHSHSRTSTSEDKSLMTVKYNGHVSSSNDDDSSSRKDAHLDRSECATPANEHRQFIEAAGTPDTRTLAQLRILYKAQARTIDELKEELSASKEEFTRESRVLTHKITLLQGDKEGLMATLDHSQTLVKETQAELLQLKTHLNQRDNQMSSIKEEKEELSRKLEHAETTIDDLNQQLANLGKSDTLARQRERQETMIKCMQQKHQQEIYHLQENLDALNKQLNDKTTECCNARDQLQSVMTLSDQTNMDHLKTVKSLQEALQEALKAGSSLELARVQGELQQTREKQQFSDELCQAMQEELNELKEQLLMYESASQFGVFSSNSRPGSRAPSPIDNHSDSFIQLNIKNNNNNNSETPSKLDTEPISDEECGVKRELKRCLLNYRQKQLQLSKSQSELRTLRRDYQTMKADMEKLADDNQKNKVEMDRLRAQQADVTSPKVSELEKVLASLQKEKSDLQVEVETLESRIGELAVSEERLTEENAKMSCEMSQMIRDFDQNRNDDVQRCQATYEQHYEESKERIKQELIANFNEERRKLIEMYQHQTEKYKSENEYLTKELMSIKEMYVSMCHEKDEIADTVHQQCSQSTVQQVDKVREELRLEKESELTKLRQSLQDSYRVKLVSAREEWQKELEDEMKTKIEAKVAEARITWFEEHRSDKQSSVDVAVQAAKNQWLIEHDTELRDKLKEAEDSWRTEQKAAVELLVQDAVTVECEKLNLKHRAEIDAIRERMEAEKTKAIDQALSKAKSDWMREMNQSEEKLRRKLEEEIRAKYEQQLAKSLSDAREKWLTEKQTELSRLVDTHRDESHESLRQEYQSKIQSLEQELSDVRAERQRLEAEMTSLRRSADDEQQTVVKMKDLEICSLKARRERLEQDLQNAKRQAASDRESLTASHQTVQARKDNEIKALKNINDMLEAEVKGMRIENETVLGQCESLKLRNENLEKEFVTAKGTWLSETEAVIREKDSEQAKVQRDLEVKYRQETEKLKQEHSDILGQALRAAKEELEKEKAELTSRYEGELQRLRERERRALETLVDNPNDKSIIQEMEHQYTRERSDVDESWTRRITSIQSRYEREKKDLIDDWQKRCDQLLNKYQSEVQSRDQLETMVTELRDALEKERSMDKNWEQKLSVLRDAYEREKDVLKASHREDLSRTVEVLKRKKDNEQKVLTEKFEKTMNEVRTELSERDDLLKQADNHLEMEVEKLRQALQVEHDERLDAEIAELHERYRAQFDQITSHERLASQKHLDEAAEKVLQTERHYESVIQTYQEKLSSLREENDQKLMELRTDLEQKQIDMHQIDVEYRRKMSELKSSLETEYNAVIESCEQEKNEFASKLDLCQEHLQRVRSEKDDLERSHQHCEQRLADAAETSRRHEREMAALSKKHEKELVDVRRQLEDHRNSTIQAMKNKVMELRKNHAVAMETMKLQFINEQRDANKSSSRITKNTQTDEVEVEKEVMQNIRTQYLNTVSKIRADVLSHVTSTNQRAAQNVRSELKKGRRLVVKKYREHCLTCVKQVLENDVAVNSSDLDSKMKALERALSSSQWGGASSTSGRQSPQLSQSTTIQFNDTCLKLSNQSEAYTNTDFSLDEDYLHKTEDCKSQQLSGTMKNVSCAFDGVKYALSTPKISETFEKSVSATSRAHDVSKTSEKYPIRNISPRRQGNTSDTDPQRSSRDLTSGYRTSSYLSMESDVSAYNNNNNTSSKTHVTNAPKYKYTSLRRSMGDSQDNTSSNHSDQSVARQPVTPESRGCYSNNTTPFSGVFTPGTKITVPREVHSAPKFLLNGYCDGGKDAVGRRHQPAERLVAANDWTDAKFDQENILCHKTVVSSRDKSKAPLYNSDHHGNVTLRSDRHVVRPVPLCTRQIQVPSR